MLAAVWGMTAVMTRTLKTHEMPLRVYVDRLRFVPPRKYLSCHMTAETIAELHAFARHCTSLTSPDYDPRGYPHYVLNPEQRVQAVLMGAEELEARPFFLAAARCDEDRWRLHRAHKKSTPPISY